MILFLDSHIGQYCSADNPMARCPGAVDASHLGASPPRQVVPFDPYFYVGSKVARGGDRTYEALLCATRAPLNTGYNLLTQRIADNN